MLQAKYACNHRVLPEELTQEGKLGERLLRGANLGIEWWSGDKLYKHYMDTNLPNKNTGGVMMRQQELVLSPTSSKRKRDEADQDQDAP